MPRDVERIERLQAAMKEAGLDALACTLPENVLLLTGYFPVVGTSVAIATREGEILLFAPEDEMDLADCDCTENLVSFRPGSLDALTNAEQAIREPLRGKLRGKGLDHAGPRSSPPLTPPCTCMATRRWSCSKARPCAPPPSCWHG
ncbi:MAG: aminopeptidase P family N-terminal domain-containing protein [Acidobacteriia bacterium]|nr:aminopeptidase P family N-terminal domain-containing protein [Terriglobia bacterium]